MIASFYLIVIYCIIFIAICYSDEKKRPKTACKDPFAEIAKITPVLNEPEYIICLDETNFDIMAGIESVNETQTKILCKSKACHGLKKLVEDTKLEECLLNVLDQEIAINYDISSIFDRCDSISTSPPSKNKKPILPTDLQYATPVVQVHDNIESSNITNTKNFSCTPAFNGMILDILNGTSAMQCRDKSQYDLHLVESDKIPDAMCSTPECHISWNSLNKALSRVPPCIVEVDGIPLDLALALRRIDEKCSFSKETNASSSEKKNEHKFAETSSENIKNESNTYNNNATEPKPSNHGSTTILSTTVMFLSFSVMFML